MSKKYIIGWVIDGATEIEADSPEEAEAKFSRLSVLDLAENGTLEASYALTEEDLAQQIVDLRGGATIQ